MIPKSHGYARVTRGAYVITVPAAFTRKDVRKDDWPKVRKHMLENVVNLYTLAMDYVEQDIRNKK